MFVTMLNNFIALIIFYTRDITNIIFNPKLYQKIFAISNYHLFQYAKFQVYLKVLQK